MDKKIQINVTEDQLKLIQYFIKEMPQEDDALFEEFEDYIDARCMMMEMDRKERLEKENMANVFVRVKSHLDEMIQFHDIAYYKDSRGYGVEYGDIRKKQIASDLKTLTDCLSKFGKQS